MTPKTFILRNNTDAEALANSIAGAQITKPLRVTVEIHRKKRSLAQNSLNWLWCDTIRKWLYESGIGFKNARGETIRPYTSEEIHEWHKQLFGTARTIEVNGVACQAHRTRDMPVMEFAQYLNEIDAYWADQGLQLPQPDALYGEAMGNS